MRCVLLIPILFYGLMVFASPADAKPLSQTQRNALNHIAQAQAAADLCSKLETNETMIAIVLTAYDIDLTDAGTAAFFKAKYAEQKAPFLKLEENVACIAGLYLYGPTGENVKDLVRLRN